METLSHPNASTRTQLDKSLPNGGESVSQRHFRRPKVLVTVLFGLLVCVGLAFSGCGTSGRGAPECIKGKMGPHCSSDSDCNGLLGCVRCATSKHCTAELLPSPGPSPPSPPPPPSPTTDSSHYADPKDGCQAGEQEVRLRDIKGAFCSPACNASRCPIDVPTGASARPSCALKLEGRGSSNLYCALTCTPESNECGAATCKSIHGAGICTYDDDDGPSLGPAPPSRSNDCFECDEKGACEVNTTDGCHWCQFLWFGMCLPTGMSCDSTRFATVAFSPHANAFDATVV